MSSLSFTELEAGEEFVFGPVTTTKATSVSGSGGAPGQGGGISRTSGRTVGVTSKRIIVEDLKSPDRTQIVPNASVQRIFVKRQQRQGRASLTLVRAQTASGQTVKLDLKGLPPEAETQLQATFPNAEIAQARGALGGKAVLIVALVLFFFVCVLPIAITVLLRIFAR